MNARVLVLALFGSALCTGLDYLHATHGVLSYPHRELGAQSWWVPVLFFFASIAAMTSARIVRETSSRNPLSHATQVRTTLAQGGAFALAYAATSFFHASPKALLFFLVATWAARMLGPEGAIRTLVFSVSCALVGPAFEATWSALGFFHYEHPEVFGIPLWLAGIYLHLAPFVSSLDRLLLIEPNKHSGTAAPERSP